MFNILSGTRFMLGKTFITILLSITCLGLIKSPTAQAQEGFSTSNERSLYDAQTRAMRQKTRSQLETDLQKVRNITEKNITLDQISIRVDECTSLGKVYNGDPNNSNNPNVYCQAIVGSIPTEINFIGLAAWYDLNTSSGVQLDQNGRVQKLLDKSGNGFHIEQATSSYRPTIVTTDDYNAKANPRITLGRFDGNDALISTSKITNQLGISGNYSTSIYAVFAHDSSSSGNNYGVFGMGEGGTGGYLGFLNHNGPKYGVHHNSMGFMTTWPTTKERLILMDYHKEKSNSSYKIYLNGTEVNTTGSGTPNVQNGTLRLGRWGESSHHFKGDIAELIIYNNQLSEAQRASVQSYLINKYGLQPFVNCSSKSINTGQCTTYTGAGNHADVRNLSCPGSFGTCTNQQICLDGSWVQKSNSCPPPANCTSSVSRTLNHVYGNCTASTGTATHNQTKTFTCSGNFGSCSGRATCYNGAFGGTHAVSCPAPSGCYSTTRNNCSLSSQSHNGTTGSCSNGTTGSCSYKCYNGSWQQQSNSCKSSCSGRTISNCSIGSKSHGGSSGSCTTSHGSCSYKCNNGSWSKQSNSCTNYCTAATMSNCSVGTRASGQTATGSCTNGTTGSCSYKCNTTTWSKISNSCATPPPPPPPPPSKSGCQNPTTAHGGTTVRSCPGMHGLRSYKCNDGKWEYLYDSCSCQSPGSNRNICY